MDNSSITSSSSKRTKYHVNHEDVDEFFNSTTPPAYLETMKSKLNDFVKNEMGKRRKTVLITSGGTTIPLEKNTVRFIDNFSTGGRGAAICEHFLQSNDEYNVIFLHRTGSIMPFARHLPSRFIDLTFMSMLACKSDSEDIYLQFDKKEKQNEMTKAFQAYGACKSRLLLIPFTSLSEYLFLLKMCCENGIIHAGKDGMVVLSAAVSDFYIPEKDMIEHKIQSKEGPLHLELAQVPKCLGMIRDSWAPDSFVVSFKLETDLSILRSKALGAIEKYGVHAVVANELHTRYEKVILYQASANGNEKVIARKSTGEELDGDLVEALKQSHDEHISVSS